MTQSSVNVDSLVDKGKQDEAVKILNDLAAKNPGRKEPWLKMAKVHFGAENYAQAIVAAEEVIQRDATDRQAKTIRAVSGLRVAAKSLNDLKNDVELKGDARPDALGLAKVMRETLGEEVLVPPVIDDPKKKKPAPVYRPKPAAAPATGAQPVSGGAPSSGGGGNPFGALK
ncbi:MAG: putative lipoprotein [Proteobacteria bacterium]|nr:putative lipoprotein [Pseudomonadota bacterium]